MNKKPIPPYILLPKYTKLIADLDSILKSASEHHRVMDYCIEQGKKDSGIISGLYKATIYNCRKEIAEFERWNKCLNGTPYLKENIHPKVNYLDDFV